MAASTRLAIPLHSSTCTIQTPLMSRVKIEPSIESITIPSNDFDVSSLSKSIPFRIPT
jgi:hypothetical protein